MPYGDIWKNMNKARVGEPVRGLTNSKKRSVRRHECSVPNNIEIEYSMSAPTRG